MKIKHYTIPVFVPHKGCPNNCVFCNQKTITGTQKDVTPGDVFRIISEHLEYIDKSKAHVEVAFFGGSFTGIDFDKQCSLLEAAYEFVKDGRVDALRCSTRPDFINQKILDNLKKYALKTIELGVQSTDDEVLAISERGHTREDVFAAARIIKENGFSLGLQMMPHLPGDTYEKTMQTARDIISLSPDCVRIYPTLVVEGAQLWNMYEEGAYVPSTLENTVKICADIVELFEGKTDIIRIGLQTTDNINAHTVKGPYHEALGEMVYSEVYRRKIEKAVSQAKGSEVVFYVPEGDVSKAAGHKRSNIKYFMEKYGVEVKIKENQNKGRG